MHDVICTIVQIISFNVGIVSFISVTFIPTFFQDDDVNVTFEDQQKINKFARKSNKLAELQDEIANKKVFSDFLFIQNMLSLQFSRKI